MERKLFGAHFICPRDVRSREAFTSAVKETVFQAKRRLRYRWYMNVSYANEYMKDHIFELRRKI